MWYGRMVKTRISISISKDILKKLDSEIDGINIVSRSEAVEKIIEKHVSEKKKCVILAGGPSKNLKSEDTYRPLIKVKGKPLIKHLIDKAESAGYSDIIIVGSKEVLSEIYKIIGDSDIDYIEEKKHLGIAKTLQHAQEKIKGTFLFMLCDHYFELDLRKMEEYHKRNHKIVTLAVYSGTKYSWGSSSIVELEGNLIVEYKEHPKNRTSYLTSVMVGFAEPSIFEFIPKAELTYSLQEDVFPELAKKRELIAYIFSSKWKNIHDKEDVKDL